MPSSVPVPTRHGWWRQTKKRLVAGAGLPTRPPASMTGEQFLSLMAVDKKVMDGQLRLVLLKGIGEAVITADFDPAVLRETVHDA